MQRSPNNLPKMDFRRRRAVQPSQPTKTFHYTLSENWEPQLNKVRTVIEKENQNTFWTVREMVESTHYSGYNGEIVVLGYNVSEPFDTFKKRFPNDKIICYQLEQLYGNHSWWYDTTAQVGTPKHRNTQFINGWLNGCDEIWDYDLDNIEFLESLGFNNIKFKPMQWFNGIQTITHTEKDIDVLFYGMENNKRNKHLEKIKGYKHKIITQTFQAWGETLNEYIGRSKIILNLHYYEGHIQEQVRIFPLVANDCCVLSEPSRRNYFGNLIQEFEEGKLNEKIDWLLKDDNWKKVSSDIGEKFKGLTYGI